MYERLLVFKKNGEVVEKEYGERPEAIVIDPLVSEVCPECGSKMYGEFLPLKKRGVERWCSACGYCYPSLKDTEGMKRVISEYVDCLDDDEDTPSEK